MDSCTASTSSGICRSKRIPSRNIVPVMKTESCFKRRKQSAENSTTNAQEILTQTMITFTRNYLTSVQEEDKRCDPRNNQGGKKKIKRPDCKTLTKMISEKAVLKPKCRIGNIPGIEVGHKFYSRVEMKVLGFHSSHMSGIDFISEKEKEGYDGYILPIAVCISVSGDYEDDHDKCDELIYTGEGGNNSTGNKRQNAHQKMLRGNLGLKNSMLQNVPVRVVRKHKCKESSTSNYSGVVYTYDGLYKVDRVLEDVGLSKFKVFKFYLTRVEGQCSLTTEQVNFCRAGPPKSPSEIPGLICSDISHGLEKYPIRAINLIDGPPVPPSDKFIEGFTYIKSFKTPTSEIAMIQAKGCNCGEDGCTDPSVCACARLNGKSEFPYVETNGCRRLVESQDVVYECGKNCGCGPNCINRVSQQGIKHSLEVFKTANRGFGVRSLESIPSNSIICEYIGKLKKTDEMNNIQNDEYLFNIDCIQTRDGLEGRQKRKHSVQILHPVKKDKKNKSSSEEVEYTIDAATEGNVSRFINHSCNPNLFVQCVLSDHHDARLARICFVTARNIRKNEEFTYDYGYIRDSVRDEDENIIELQCHCGADDCSGRLY